MVLMVENFIINTKIVFIELVLSWTLRLVIKTLCENYE